jgi:hypothetical protein
MSTASRGNPRQSGGPLMDTAITFLTAIALIGVAFLAMEVLVDDE